MPEKVSRLDETSSAPLTYAIDFGTSNSLLGAAHSGRHIAPIALDPEAADPTILRSLLFFPEKGEPSFGMRAIGEYVRCGQEEISGRLIRSVKKFLPQRSFVNTTIGRNSYSLEQIIGKFLGEMRSRANTHFGQDVTRAVIGRPARFSDEKELDLLAQERLESAARLAGFTEIHFCPEPIAAAYEFRATLSNEKTVLVADFGGGTSDFTVIKLKPGTQPFAPDDVLSIGGISIAGDALDGAIMRKGIAPFFGADVQYQVPFGSNILTMPVHLMEKICSPADISMLRKRDTIEFFKNVRDWALSDADRDKMDRLFTLIDEQLGFALFEQIERTKRALGTHEVEDFHFQASDVDIQTQITRAQFEDYSRDRLERVLSTIDDTVRAAGLRPEQIDLVCATGGTAKVPALALGLAERFGAAKVTQHNHFHSITQGLIEFAGDLIF